MAARSTVGRLTGIALASLCLATASRAQQVVYPGSAFGCYGSVCIPLSSLGLLTGTGLASDLSAFRSSAGWGAFTTSGPNGNAQADAGTGSSGFHFNQAVAAYTGLTFGAFIVLLNQPGHQESSATTAAATNSNADVPAVTNASVDVPPPTTFSIPIGAHLEFAETSALVTTPEPMTFTLMATGLVALAGITIRRRRREDD